jgi:hypothetical protein
MPPRAFLLLNLALAFYNVGTIWAHEVDIFRSWRLVGPTEFHRVQAVHWRKLPYWVLGPVGLALAAALALPWAAPPGAPRWGAWGAIAVQGASLLLTALLWAPWQARLAQDGAGPRSPYLARILATHWVRTLLVNANAAVLLAWSLRLLGAR